MQRLGIYTVLGALTPVTYAQTTAEITGRLTDATNAAAPGAKVTAVNVHKGTRRTTTSNDKGYYTLTSIDTGSYDVTVDLSGFQTITRTGIKLDVNESRRLDFTLTVGTINEKIEVIGEASVVETNSGQLGTVMTEEKIADLPLNARNFSQLLSLTPGAAPVSVAQNNQGGQTTQRIGMLVFPAVNGQTNRSNSFTLEVYTTTATLPGHTRSHRISTR